MSYYLSRRKAKAVVGAEVGGKEKPPEGGCFTRVAFFDEITGASPLWRSM